MSHGSRVLDQSWHLSQKEGKYPPEIPNHGWVGGRREGHNLEGEEPSSTQPLQQEDINKNPSLWLDEDTQAAKLSV